MACRRGAAAGVAMVVLGWLGGCGDSKPPVAPSPAGRDATVTGIELEGPGEVAPLASAQFKVTARFSNGVVLDVTGLSTWSVEPYRCQGCPSTHVLAVQNGVVRALGPGEGTVWAAYESMRASKLVIAVPEGTYRLTGVVREVAPPSAPVSGAAVSAKSEPGTTVSTLTGANGEFRLYGAVGATTVLATKDGYQPRQEFVQVNTHSTLDLDLPPSRPDWSSDKTYVLTIRAAKDCAPAGTDGALPVVARERRYVASIAEMAASVFARLSGAQFALAPAGGGGTGGNGFHGRAEGPGLVFSINGYSSYYWDLFPYPDLVEQISDSQFLVIAGRAEVTGGTLTGVLDGSITLFNKDIRPPAFGGWQAPAWVADCTSTGHEFTLTG